jgi:histidine triad (HIT) family protein
MDQEKNCKFCEIASGASRDKEYIVYEDKETIAFLARDPQTQEREAFVVPLAEGHILVTPKNHLVNIFDADPQTLGKIMSVAKLFSLKMEESLGSEGVLLYLSSGEASGQEVFHLHLHVIPRRKDDGIRVVGPAFKLSEEDQSKLASKLCVVYRSVLNSPLWFS